MRINTIEIKYWKLVEQIKNILKKIRKHEKHVWLSNDYIIHTLKKNWNSNKTHNFWNNINIRKKQNIKGLILTYGKPKSWLHINNYMNYCNDLYIYL